MLVSACTLAPLSMRYLTISTWPSWAASIRGVDAPSSISDPGEERGEGGGLIVGERKKEKKAYSFQKSREEGNSFRERGRERERESTVFNEVLDDVQKPPAAGESERRLLSLFSLSVDVGSVLYQECHHFLVSLPRCLHQWSVAEQDEEEEEEGKDSHEIILTEDPTFIVVSYCNFIVASNYSSVVD